LDGDLARVAAAGFNALRLYEMPDRRLLDAATRHGLSVCGGLKWRQSADFCQQPDLFAAALAGLEQQLRAVGTHPALAAVYVGNEVPADLVRWMGPARVRHALERLIARGRKLAPHLLFAYASYPTTEYLEPENADFSAFNVYLESAPEFRSYLKRLHHIAGDRPLVISEFGLDSRRNGTARQAESLSWALAAAAELETAGMTIYAWSDRWWNAGAEVLDWDFGLVDRQGQAKPALAAVTQALSREGRGRQAWTTSGAGRLPVVEPAAPPAPPPPASSTDVSVIVCTRNGRQRIGTCLAALGRLAPGSHELIVVDDGSTDGTADEVAARFPQVRLVRISAQGLSAARNAGAAAATGEVLAFTDDDCEPDPEWLERLRRVFATGRFAAVGGPNLPPRPQTWEEAIVCAAPGAPSHVMLDDEEAEHLPGCNLAVTRTAFAAIGGFDPVFQTAGDDVDFCWRLRDAGFRLGFAAGAFVWHWRRPSVRLFLRQQLGYGRAERLLLAKHPHRFSAHGGARWEGFVYGGGPVRAVADSVIYHGPMGLAGYQAVLTRCLPLRSLDSRFDAGWTRLVLRLVTLLQPRLRAWGRTGSWRLPPAEPPPPAPPPPTTELDLVTHDGRDRTAALQLLLADQWTPGGGCEHWDVTKHGTRVLLATETGDGPAKRTRIRVWGNPTLLPAGLRNRGSR
jgi:GT2 family glycosyltransferase